MLVSGEVETGRPQYRKVRVHGRLKSGRKGKGTGLWDRGEGSQVYFQLLEGPFKLPGVWDRSSLGGCIHWKSPTEVLGRWPRCLGTYPWLWCTGRMSMGSALPQSTGRALSRRGFPRESAERILVLKGKAEA